MKLNSLERGHNVDAAVLDGAAPIICEPSTQGNVYVNVEYASIERKQFVIIDEESEDEDEELFEDDNSEEVNIYLLPCYNNKKSEKCLTLESKTRFQYDNFGFNECVHEVLTTYC